MRAALLPARLILPPGRDGMIIALLAEQMDGLGSLAEALRRAGHDVRILPPHADVVTGGVVPDAVLACGPAAPAGVTRFVSIRQSRCAIALLEKNEVESWRPDCGYSDFVVSPYRPAEVLVRMAMHQHRHRGEESDVIRSGSLVIDVNNYSIHAGPQRIELTYKEFELLRFLVTHPGRVFTRDALLENVWGYDYWGGSRTIDVHIRRIRSKLPVDIASRIETVHQVGYRYASPRE